MMNNSQMGNMFDLESQSFSVFDPTASPTQDNGNNIVGSNGGASDQATVNNGGKASGETGANANSTDISKMLATR